MADGGRGHRRHGTRHSPRSAARTGTRPLTDRVKESLFGALDAEGVVGAPRPFSTSSPALARAGLRHSAAAAPAPRSSSSDGWVRVVSSGKICAARMLAGRDRRSRRRRQLSLTRETALAFAAVLVDPPYSERAARTRRYEAGCSRPAAGCPGRRRRRQALLARCAGDPNRRAGAPSRQRALWRDDAVPLPLRK